MFELSEEPKYNTRNLTKAQGSAWAIYRRLLGYAFQYKWRLAVSIFFALIVAGSFGAVILSLAATVEVLFWEGDASGAIEGASQPESASVTNDLVDRYTKRVDQAPDFIFALTPWTKPEAREKVRAVISGARTNGQDKMAVLATVCGVVLLLTVLGGVARYLQEYFAGTIGASISVTLGQEMVANVMQQSLRFFEERPTGEILARFTNDIFMVNRGLAGVFVKMMREPIKAVVFIILAFRADWLLTLLGLCVLPLIAAVIVRLGKKFKKSVRRSLERIASMASIGNEAFSGITIVKGFCMEAYEMGRAQVEFRKLRRYLVRMVKIDAAVGPVVEVLMTVGIVAFVLFAAWRVIAGEVGGDDLVALVFSLAFIMDPVRKLSSVNNLIMTSVASAERVFEYIDARPDIVEKPNAIELPPMRDAIRFNNVDFSYDGKSPVLVGLDFDIKKGETVALVGFSGAGKSTIAKLIPRFYDVSSGSLTIDGIDVRDVTFQSLRKQISIVTQDTILFNETIRDNIAFGDASYGEEDVRRAAAAAHATDFIERLASGYQTMLGAGGSKLSGGQRQRLAIARALIKDPAILILDEATSSLDSESEQAIQEAFTEFTVGRTTVVIAHRLSTVQRADRILVLDNGCVAEQGTHHELMMREGIYRRLYETQFQPNPDA